MSLFWSDFLMMKIRGRNQDLRAIIWMSTSGNLIWKRFLLLKFSARNFWVLSRTSSWKTTLTTKSWLKISVMLSTSLWKQWTQEKLTKAFIKSNTWTTKYWRTIKFWTPLFQSSLQEYAGLDDFNYENYSTWEVYQQWQDDFVAANSDLVSKTAYGQSYEKRELNYMKLGKGKIKFWVFRFKLKFKDRERLFYTEVPTPVSGFHQ